jgi:hypothetical protein
VQVLHQALDVGTVGPAGVAKLWFTWVLLQPERQVMLLTVHMACVPAGSAAIRGALAVLSGLTSASAGAAETRGLATATVPAHVGSSERRHVMVVRQCGVCSMRVLKRTHQQEVPTRCAIRLAGLAHHAAVHTHNTCWCSGRGGPHGL